MAVCSGAPNKFVMARNLLDEKPNYRNSRKKMSTYNFGSRLCPLMSLPFVDSKRSLTNRLRGCRPNASELVGDQQFLEQYGVLPDSGHALPANLSWLWSLARTVDDPSPDRPSPRTSCKWMGVIFELEGVIVEHSDPELVPHAWFILCEEEGKQFPPDTVLRSIEGMKTEEAISEVLGWSEDPLELQRLASRKEEIYRCLHGAEDYRLRSGTREFLNRLVDYGIPTAVVSARPRKSLEEAIQAVGLGGYFACVVAAEDLDRGKPDPEMFKRAAELLDLEAEQCIVIGNSDSTVAAAAGAGMSCVVVASNRPVYDFRAAARVVRWLDELSIVDLDDSTRINPIQQRARERHMEIVRSNYL